ncbi:MAG: glycosyltransferase family 39 protein, partial [Phycisphaerae bacterium]|nr:glycosyltransferase family 39 protein [Phycisphaerae bacterium]
MPSNVEPTNRNHAPFSARAALLAVFASWLLLAVVRLTAPSDLLDNDQARPAMYALDILRNAHWIVQTDPSGDIASKPPLYTWLVAIVAAVSGRVNEWTLYIPTSLAVLGIALLVNRAASTRFGPVPGLLAAGAFLFSPFAAKHLALARTDALFALAVTGAALLAYRAWTTDRRGRWTLFWIACVLATLTKGPLGVVLALGGLVPLVWSDPKRVGRGVWLDLSAGIVIYAALCGGWLLAAHAQMGQPVIDKLIGRELLGHAASSDSGGMPLLSFYK